MTHIIIKGGYISMTLEEEKIIKNLKYTKDLYRASTDNEKEEILNLYRNYDSEGDDNVEAFIEAAIAYITKE